MHGSDFRGCAQLPLSCHSALLTFSQNCNTSPIILSQDSRDGLYSAPKLRLRLVHRLSPADSAVECYSFCPEIIGRTLGFPLFLQAILSFCYHSVTLFKENGSYLCVCMKYVASTLSSWMHSIRLNSISLSKM